MARDLVALTLQAAKRLPKTRSPVADPTASLLGVVTAWQSYQQVRAQEETRREEIRAQAEVAIARIQAQTQVLRQLIDQTFAERRENFNRFFSMLEDGLRTGNDRQIEAALTMIVTQIKESPIRQVAETVRQIRTRKEGEIIEL